MAHESDHMVESAEQIVSESVPRRSKEDLDFIELATTLARRKNTIAKFTIVGTLLAVVISLMLQVKYTGTTVILPPQQSQSFSSMVLGQVGMLAGLGRELGLKSTIDLYIAMLRSESVQNGLIQQFNLRDAYHQKTMFATREELTARTTLVPIKAQGVIRLSVEDSDPKRAADLANGYIEQLHALNQRIAIGESSERRMFFENQLQRAKEGLTAAEQTMKQTQEKTGMLQLDAQSRAMIQTVATLRAQIVGKEVQLQGMRSFATGQNPDYVIAQQQLAGLREQLAKLLRSQNISEGDLEIPTSKLPETGLAYLRAYRNVRYQEAIYEIIARQYEAARLDEAKSAAFPQVIDPAMVPERKSSPKRARIVIFVFLLSFLSGCAFVLAQQAYGRFVADPFNRERIDTLKAHFRF
jgi:uncharacterized protein involved in exopolysaccharide biosynthesis